MEKKGLPQEGLKLIACITMLLDHIGAALIPSLGLRIIGRIAFPIYCFLLAEGAHYTKSMPKYALRLALVMVLAELPFDYGLFGGITLAYQSVMVTLLLGLGALAVMKKVENPMMKLVTAIPFAALAELLRTDYGGYGVIMAALFGIARDLPNGKPLMAAGLLALCLTMNSAVIPVFGVRIPIEVFAMAALLPIFFYSGRKATHSKAIQWAFTLFYPVHLAVIALVRFL